MMGVLIDLMYIGAYIVGAVIVVVVLSTTEI